MPPPFLPTSRLVKTLDICLDKLYSFADLTAIPTVVLRKLQEFASKNDIFLRNGRHRVVMLMSVFVQNIVDLIVDYALWLTVLKKEF